MHVQYGQFLQKQWYCVVIKNQNKVAYPAWSLQQNWILKNI